MKRTDWPDLAIFAAIADARSFTGAAARMGVSASALSHAMRGLEDRIGVRLLNRTTRSVAPTAAGDVLLASLRPAMTGVADTLRRLEGQRDAPAGPLRITAHRTAAAQCIVPHLDRFAGAFPQVDLELVLEDGLTDIVAGRFDAGVRHEQKLELDMIAVRIGVAQRTAIVASPGYFASRPPPQHPDDIRHHRCLNYRHTSSGAIQRWQFVTAGHTRTVDAPGQFVSNDADLIVQAALAGAGLACVLEGQVAADLGSGRLIRVLEQYCPLVPANHLYYPGRRQISAALRAFIDTLRTATAAV
jgi:DNA-binding transcriptional LysR family regulator